MHRNPDKYIFFFTFLMEKIIPYEVKLVSLLGKKDYEIPSSLWNSFHNLTKKEDFSFNDAKQFIKSELDDIAIKIQQNYIDALGKNYASVINAGTKETIKKFLDNKNYIEAIKKIEEALEIEQLSLQTNQYTKHIGSSIYKKDFEILKKSIIDFNQSLIYLQRSKNNLIESQRVSEEVQPIEFLYYVVYSEIWNTLSHIAYAYSYFNTPRQFISNLQKANTHLKRATLDIYDALILEHEQVHVEYLSIRMQKLNSLGNNTKIEDLVKNLHNHYVQIIDSSL